MSLWDWSVRAWTSPGLADAGLDLQDAQGQCVPLLLWAAWAASTGRAPDADTIEAACDTARAWSETTVAPLRAIRRTLRAAVPDMDDGAREAIRAQVKTAELEAERHLLTALEALSSEPWTGPQPALPGLIAVAREWSSVTPRTALRLFADRLPT